MVHPTIRPTLTVHVHVPIQRGMSISKLCVNTMLSSGIVVFLRCIRRMRNLGAYEWYFVLYGMSCVSEKGSYSPFPLSWNDAVGSGNGWWHRWESTSLSSTLWYLDIQRCTILVTHIYIFSYVVRGVSTLCSRRALWATILIVSRWAYLCTIHSNTCQKCMYKLASIISYLNVAFLFHNVSTALASFGMFGQSLQWHGTKCFSVRTHVSIPMLYSTSRLWPLFC